MHHLRDLKYHASPTLPYPFLGCTHTGTGTGTGTSDHEYHHACFPCSVMCDCCGKPTMIQGRRFHYAMCWPSQVCRLPLNAYRPTDRPLARSPGHSLTHSLTHSLAHSLALECAWLIDPNSVRLSPSRPIIPSHLSAPHLSALHCCFSLSSACMVVVLTRTLAQSQRAVVEGGNSSMEVASRAQYPEDR